MDIRLYIKLNIYYLKKGRHRQTERETESTCAHGKRRTGKKRSQDGNEVRSGWKWAWLALKVTAKNNRRDCFSTVLMFVLF